MNARVYNDDRDLFPASLHTVPACQQRVADTDWFPPVDVSEEGVEYLLTVDLPGLRLEDIQISRDDAALYLNGERKTLRRGENCLRAERPAGIFMRRLALPADACSEEIQAILQDGVLELHVPRKLPPDSMAIDHLSHFKSHV